ncbi:prophage tail fiber N-terminal domain-containing protein [Serratia oryzae]|uniref:prophage tail fiber N-terminal domain-containing protein n=1 Tax=Serratia oryzae TaxID=2034155 RepID=UPI0012E2119E|nr:prophage tail fiber N-terminal domain-containing protein [Serratia oryzae]
MITLSGIYRSPEGIPIPSANLVITSRHNTRQTFLQIAASVTTGPGGEYKLELYPGEYAVTVVYKNGQRAVLGMFTLLDSSPPATLNDYLVESAPELTGPIVLAEIRAAAQQAQKSEDNSKISELAAAQSAQDATHSASLAANSELSAGKSRDDAAKSASAAGVSATAALKSEISARDSAQRATDTVANNAAMITQVSQQVDAVSAAAVVTAAKLSAVQCQQRGINGELSAQLAAETAMRVGADSALSQRVDDALAFLATESSSRLAADEVLHLNISQLTATTDGDKKVVLSQLDQLTQQVDAVSAAVVVTNSKLNATQNQQRTLNSTFDGQLELLDNQNGVLANAIDGEAKNRAVADAVLTQSISALRGDVNAADAALSNSITVISQALASANTAQAALTTNIDDRVERAATTAIEARIANANVLSTLRQLASSLSTINARLTAFESSN